MSRAPGATRPAKLTKLEWLSSWARGEPGQLTCERGSESEEEEDEEEFSHHRCESEVGEREGSWKGVTAQQ